MASIKEVAKRAGVGLGTVSRVINNSGPVKESTRVKVEQVIAELNYKPNEVARSFKRKQTQTVALIVPTLWHPFFSQFAYHTEKLLSKFHYKMIVCNSENKVENEIEYISMLEQNKIDGIIAITYSKEIDQYISSHLPIVSIDRHFTNDVTYVSSDNKAGGKIAAEELLRRGSKSLAYLGSVSEIKNESFKRFTGFEEELRERNYSFEKMIINEPVDDIRFHVRRFLEQNNEIDGIFAMNDKWAKITIEILHELNKKIPEEVQVVGYDGLASSKDDELTFSTIVQPIAGMAEKAVEHLIHDAKAKEEAKQIILPVSFYAGNSTNEFYVDKYNKRR
ncbi:transcriptional regulator, LacI family [Marinococcus luteus]|uniref:Transcriptional regulator, LacI family n=1 Tax=Marinococcus luteus TaxID=1122204 RepID=A0A1H2QLJ6_9BACI|nr:LacI family DNA-binding transcriptional regulator [Marinococcus luteus]SDW08083.1 transcriptional regulator, LacI family [Marinococcus luteus]